MPVIPRPTTVYPVPPVCTVYWTAEDWARTARVVWEPLDLDGSLGPWVAVGRGDDGRLLYQRREAFPRNGSG